MRAAIAGNWKYFDFSFLLFGADDLNRGGVLVNPEVTKKLQQAKIKLRDYETAVKAEIKDLAKEKQELKGHPLLGVKRIIGRDLMDYAAS